MAGQGRTVPRATVILPAHDEADVVERCLESLLADAEPGEFDVLLVANGCSDDTAPRARAAAERLGHEVRVLELPEASKAAALRAADGMAGTGPRVYLDVDVVCSTATLRALVDELRSPGVDLAVPSRELDLTSASRASRLYYMTWSRSPEVRTMLSGRGCYALSQAGREALGPLPDHLADDRFVTTAVPRQAARVVAAPVRITPPGDLRTVLAVRERVYAGNLLLGAVPGERARSTRRLALELAVRPSQWPGALVYGVVTGLAKSRARAAVRRGPVGWGRDPARGGGRGPGRPAVAGSRRGMTSGSAGAGT